MLTWITQSQAAQIKTVSQTQIPPALAVYLKGISYRDGVMEERQKETRTRAKTDSKEMSRWGFPSLRRGFSQSPLNSNSEGGGKKDPYMSFIARKFDNK